MTYDGDTYYLPGGGDQVKAGSPGGGSEYSFYSNFPTNGATPSVLQSCVSGSTVTGFEITWTDGTVQGVGVLANNGKCTASTKTLFFNVEGGEVITSIQMQGNSGVLCNFNIITTAQTVNLGNPSCGGNNDATTSVASGIVGGFFGYASSSTVYQLGLLMLQDISNVDQSTVSFNSYPSSPQNTQIGGQSINVTGSQTEGTGILTYTQQSGYSSTYAKTQTATFGASVGISASYSYAETTPIVSSSASVTANMSYSYTQSLTTSSSSTTDTVTTIQAQYNLCCPPGYYCVWQIYQGQGSISSTNPAQTTLATSVQFKTGTTTNYNSSSAWSGASSSPTLNLVLTTQPPPDDGSTIDGVSDYCNSSRRRQMLGSDTVVSRSGKFVAQDLNFPAVYKNPKPNKLKYIESRLSKLGISRKNLYSHNPWMSKLKPDSTVPKGKVFKYRVQEKGFIQQFTVKKTG